MKVFGIFHYEHITINKEFTSGFDKWCNEWKRFLDKQTLLISGKTTYTHRRLRSARRSVKTHLKWLYTYEEYSELEIPNTTNRLEGFNSQLKRSLRNHNSMKEINKKKFIDGFLKIKKVDWNYQPSKCPLRLFSLFLLFFQ